MHEEGAQGRRPFAAKRTRISRFGRHIVRCVMNCAPLCFGACSLVMHSIPWPQPLMHTGLLLNFTWQHDGACVDRAGMIGCRVSDRVAVSQCKPYHVFMYHTQTR